MVIRGGADIGWVNRRQGYRMLFYATRSGERIYVLEMPIDDQAVHLPDLAKLGVSDFQSKHPELSLRDDQIEFGFERS